MLHGVLQVPTPRNEPVREYPPGSAETRSLQDALEAMAAERLDIPAVIGGQTVKTGRTAQCVMPHDHAHVLADYHLCGETEVELAIEAAQNAWLDWSEAPWQERAAVFLRAADLLAGPWRDRLNASTMLGQSKTCYQAEIDAACELIDFWRFNCHYLTEMYADQPSSPAGVWNQMEYRALEGFIFAVTPFNFTSICANLPTAPALLGNTVLWKPAPTQMFSAWFIMQLLEAAGLPPGVINMLPGEGADVGDPVLASPDLAGIHFTGSTKTFQHLWSAVGQDIDRYKAYPRIVGETGGKDFILAHPSAEVDALVVALLRGAFEYQGQKCSAASRGFIPESLWDAVISGLESEVARLKVGDPADFSNFMGAVIDERAFDKITGYIERAEASDDHEILIGGGSDKAKGYFVQPTVVRADNPYTELMTEEIFGPVLTLYRYPDDALEEVVEAVDGATPYGLTGAVFARDRYAAADLSQRLRHAAGNFYINDKPTGAVVGQQPFGGGRASGTNDKAGSLWNLIRWASPRAIKENFNPPTDWRYPHLGE